MVLSDQRTVINFRPDSGRIEGHFNLDTMVIDPYLDKCEITTGAWGTLWQSLFTGHAAACWWWHVYHDLLPCSFKRNE